VKKGVISHWSFDIYHLSLCTHGKAKATIQMKNDKCQMTNEK